MSSKLAYLSKYTTVDNGGTSKSKSKKKKSKKEKSNKEKSAVAATTTIIVEEDAGMPSPPNEDDDDDDDQERPMVVNLKHSVSDDQETLVKPRRRRHDNSSDDDSLPRSRRRVRRHDSSSSDDDNNNNNGTKKPVRPRYDSDDDDNETDRPRNRHDSDNDSDKPPTKRHDSNDHRVSHKRRHDSDDESDDVVPRRKFSGDRDERTKSLLSRHDTKEKHHRDGRRSDSSMDSGTKRGHRRRRHDSEDSDTSRRHRQTSRQDTREQMSSGHVAGLQQAHEFRSAETELQHCRKQEAQAMVDRHGMGETIYRDVHGRKVDDDVAESKGSNNNNNAKTSVAPLDEKAQALLNKGRVQKEQEEAQQRQWKDLQTSSFARHADDAGLDDMRRDIIRVGDPMAAQAYQSQTQQRAISGRPERPTYKGPAPKPNRYNIRPGYRWDGVDRGNGFEDKVLARQFSVQRKKEDAYRWSSADM